MTTHDRGFTITRLIGAPREAVWRAWTDPAHLGWFFNPDHDPGVDAVSVDLRVGGAWRQRMVIGADTSYLTGGVYRAIDPPERLVFTWGAVGGWPELDPADPESAEAPLATVLLNDLGERTELVFRVDFPAGVDTERLQAWLARGIREGWTATIDRLVTATADSPVS